MRFLLLWIFGCNSYPLDLWFVGLTERFVGRFCQRLDVSLGFGHCAPGSHISGIAGCWHSPPDNGRGTISSRDGMKVVDMRIDAAINLCSLPLFDQIWRCKNRMTNKNTDEKNELWQSNGFLNYHCNDIVCYQPGQQVCWGMFFWCGVFH